MNNFLDIWTFSRHVQMSKGLIFLDILDTLYRVSKCPENLTRKLGGRDAF